MSSLALRIGNVIFYVAMIIANWSAVAIPLFGRETGEISDMYPTAITPAGYAFSIWGIIYSLLFGFILLQLKPKYAQQPEFARIGPWFILSCVFNIAWIIVWHALQLQWTVLVMIALLITLIVIYLRTRPVGPTTPRLTRVFASGTFSVYLGWISVATIVNISVALYDAGWDGWGIAPENWAILLLIIACLLAFIIAYRFQDSAYGLVIAWATLAVAVKQQAVYPTLGLVAYIIVGLIIVNTLWLWGKAVLFAKSPASPKLPKSR